MQRSMHVVKRNGQKEPVSFDKVLRRIQKASRGLAVHPDAKGITGKYWASCNVSTPSPHGQDDELAARMWKETEALVNSLTD